MQPETVKSFEDHSCAWIKFSISLLTPSFLLNESNLCADLHKSFLSNFAQIYFNLLRKGFLTYPENSLRKLNRYPILSLHIVLVRDTETESA
jgi:hypothetical protein